MKINCQTSKLINAINIIFKTASSKTTMPILEGVLIEAYNNKIKLTTYDLEMACTHNMECEVIEEGSTVIDVKMLSEIVRRIGADNLDIETDDKKFIIKSVNGIFKLSVMNPEEYPKLPTFSIESSIGINQKLFKDMIKKTLFAVSNDDSRPSYTGALFNVENNVLSLVALDGFRLAIKKYENEKDINNFKAIIPGKVLSELLKILTDNEDDIIKIGVNKNQALFELDNTVIISKIISGEFLNYKSIIPESIDTKIKINTKKLLDALERVALFANESSDKDQKCPIKMEISVEGLSLSCKSQTGDAKEDLTCYLEGRGIVIGFNPKYLIETLRVIDDLEVYIDFTSNIAPVVIRPIGDDNFLYIVLPLKLRD